MDYFYALDERLYRGLHSIWIEEDNSVSSAAFKDSGGISVDRDGGRDEVLCVKRMINNLPMLAGVGRLTSGDVKDCGAMLKYLPVDGNEYHAEIHDSAVQIQIKSRSKSRSLAKKCMLVFKKEN